MDNPHDQHEHNSGFDPNADELFIEPPKWPKVIGILSIVFGGIAVCCGGFDAAGGPIQGMMVESNLNGAPLPPGFDVDPIILGSKVSVVLVNVLLVIAGVLCVTRKASSRVAHLLYALALIPLQIFAAKVALDTLDALMLWAEEYPDNDIAKPYNQARDVMEQFATIMVIVMTSLSLMWPLFCIIWFGFVKTKPHQMTGEQDPQDPMMT